MQPVFREFMIWVMQFLCISLGGLLAVHLVMRRVRKAKAEERRDTAPATAGHAPRPAATAPQSGVLSAS